MGLTMTQTLISETTVMALQWDPKIPMRMEATDTRTSSLFIRTNPNQVILMNGKEIRRKIVEAKQALWVSLSEILEWRRGQAKSRDWKRVDWV